MNIIRIFPTDECLLPNFDCISSEVSIINLYFRGLNLWRSPKMTSDLVLLCMRLIVLSTPIVLPKKTILSFSAGFQLSISSHSIITTRFALNARKTLTQKIFYLCYSSHMPRQSSIDAPRAFHHIIAREMRGILTSSVRSGNGPYTYGFSPQGPIPERAGYPDCIGMRSSVPTSIYGIQEQESC